METITLELPDHWATALFYDDTSGFEYEDDTQFQDFCDWAVKKIRYERASRYGRRRTLCNVS